MMKINNIPAWAYMNTALLFFPVALGLFVFYFWLIPNEVSNLIVLSILIIYYAVIFQICRYTSGVKNLWETYKKTNPTWRNSTSLFAGLIMFAFLAYGGIYVISATLSTSLGSDEIKREFTVSAYYNPYSKFCDYKLIIKEASPVMGKGFCIDSEEHVTLTKGAKIILHGKESIFGFRFTKIEN